MVLRRPIECTPYYGKFAFSVDAEAHIRSALLETMRKANSDLNAYEKVNEFLSGVVRPGAGHWEHVVVIEIRPRAEKMGAGQVRVVGAA